MNNSNVFKKGIRMRKALPINRCAYVSAALLFASQMAYANPHASHSFENSIVFSKLQQELTITGTVTSAGSNEPLAGVTIRVLGTSKASSTNQQGQFEIKAKVGEVIEFSYIGHAPKTITVASTTTNIQVQLDEDDTSLEEVVVTGYGTQRKRDLTGSVAIVDVNALKSQPAAFGFTPIPTPRV